MIFGSLMYTKDLISIFLNIFRNYIPFKEFPVVTILSYFFLLITTIFTVYYSHNCCSYLHKKEGLSLYRLYVENLKLIQVFKFGLTKLTNTVLLRTS